MIPEKIEALKICLEFIPGNASVEQVLTEAEKVYRWLADLPAAPQGQTLTPTASTSILPAQLPLRLQSAQPKSAHSRLIEAWMSRLTVDPLSAPDMIKYAKRQADRGDRALLDAITACTRTCTPRGLGFVLGGLTRAGIVSATRTRGKSGTVNAYQLVR